MRTKGITFDRKIGYFSFLCYIVQKMGSHTGNIGFLVDFIFPVSRDSFAYFPGIYYNFLLFEYFRIPTSKSVSTSSSAQADGWKSILNCFKSMSLNYDRCAKKTMLDIILSITTTTRRIGTAIKIYTYFKKHVCRSLETFKRDH